MIETLTDRLVTVAENAIRAERRALEADPRWLRGVVLEIGLGGHGEIIEGMCHISRRARLLPERRQRSGQGGSQPDAPGALP